VELPNLQTGIDATDAKYATTWKTPAVHTTAETKYDFTSVDTYASGSTSSDYLGAVFEMKVAGQKFQYQITKDDVALEQSAGADQQDLSVAIAKGFKDKLEAAFGKSGETFTMNFGTAGIIDVTQITGGEALNADDVGRYVEGALSSIGGSSIAITDATKAYEGLQAIDSALQTVNAQRSNMGALISRLQFASDNLSNVSAKAAESRSRIEDTDYSVATTELAKRNIIQQAAQAMLAQANQAPQMVLQLLK
jgi:flagellin-like hook-associated protein FlgL